MSRIFVNPQQLDFFCFSCDLFSNINKQAEHRHTRNSKREMLEVR